MTSGNQNVKILLFVLLLIKDLKTPILVMFLQPVALLMDSQAAEESPEFLIL